ncbi:MAG: aminodeoxychorismate/anthranilate synthase component II [Bacteroidales bacterium]|nr:aminodeoxychorismate/anthranilate synthase component II [Bacteroidales bacterium]
MKILVLDNYDSFTYNLVHLLRELTSGDIDVFRNDEIALEQIENYDKILISPGPGLPDHAGITKKMITRFAPSKSIFGVCLGCQAIGEAFGGGLINLNTVYHGVETKIFVLDRDEKLFSEIPETFTAGRYHSWVLDEKKLPPDITITAGDEEGNIMAISHKTLDVRGVQFHPESIMTKYGMQIVKNWLKI